MNSDEIAYISGLFDGEGCIQLRKLGDQNGNRLNLTLVVSLTNEEVILYLKEIFGGSVSKREATERNAPVYRWDCAAKKAEHALRVMYPYLRIKRDEAEIALRFRAAMPKKGNKGLSVEDWKPLFELKDQLTEAKFKNNPYRLQKYREKTWERI